MRSESGQGEQVRIYVLGPAEKFSDSVVGATGENHATANVLSIGEDFAKTHWPVVVKAKLNVSPEDLVMHLRNIAGAIEGGLYSMPEPTDHEIGMMFSTTNRGTD